MFSRSPKTVPIRTKFEAGNHITANPTRQNTATRSRRHHDHTSNATHTKIATTPK